MMDKDKADVAAVTITIKGSKGALADKAAKQALQTSIQNDAAKALGVMSRSQPLDGGPHQARCVNAAFCTYPCMIAVRPPWMG